MLLGSPQCLFLIAPSWFPNVYSSIVEVVIQTQIWSLYNNTDYRRTSHPFVLSYIYLGNEKLNTGIYDKKIILTYSKHSFFEWCCQFATINSTIYASRYWTEILFHVSRFSCAYADVFQTTSMLISDTFSLITFQTKSSFYTAFSINWMLLIIPLVSLIRM